MAANHVTIDFRLTETKIAESSLMAILHYLNAALIVGQDIFPR